MIYWSADSQAARRERGSCFLFGIHEFAFMVTDFILLLCNERGVQLVKDYEIYGSWIGGNDGNSYIWRFNSDGTVRSRLSELLGTWIFDSSTGIIQIRYYDGSVARRFVEIAGDTLTLRGNNSSDLLVLKRTTR